MSVDRLDVEPQLLDGRAVIQARGEIDLYTVPRFKEVIRAALDQGHSTLLIDLSEVAYMDSSGFGALVGATKRLQPASGVIALIGCNDIISRMLRITRLNTVFHVFETKGQALQEFGGRLDGGPVA